MICKPCRSGMGTSDRGQTSRKTTHLSSSPPIITYGSSPRPNHGVSTRIHSSKPNFIFSYVYAMYLSCRPPLMTTDSSPIRNHWVATQIHSSHMDQVLLDRSCSVLTWSSQECEFFHNDFHPQSMLSPQLFNALTMDNRGLGLYLDVPHYELGGQEDWEEGKVAETK